MAENAVFDENAEKSVVGLAGEAWFGGKANRPAAALARMLVFEDIANKFTAGLATEAVVDVGTDNSAAGSTGLAMSAGFTALAGVKPKPNPVVGAGIGEVPNRLEVDLSGNSGVALVFEAPNRPLNGEFDGLGAVTLTTGDMLWLPNLIGLSAFHV